MRRTLLFILGMAFFAVSGRAIVVTDTIFDRSAHEEFAFGADVSFVPAMEGWGTKWLDKNGKQKDILQILKEQGINNIRLRVWTVKSGSSSKQEVVEMCKRAKAKGMGVMIDFHYSDTWADPGSQTIPSAWTDHSVEALAKNVYDHTYDVLMAIKNAGVVPKWVQVGNETKRGMLYPVGQTNKGGSEAFAKFVQSGYDACKAVDPSIQVIVHLDSGHDNSLYRSIFDGLKKYGAKWDIIGLSAYPRWSHLDGPTMITKVMDNINDLKSRYKTPCMVVETGHYPTEAIVGNQYLVGLMDRLIKNKDLGCFYWEPESMGGYDMGAWDEATKRPTAMMDAFLGVKHTEVSWLMQAKMQSPKAEQTVAPGEFILQANARHVRPARIKSVTFYYDRKKGQVLTARPFESTITEDVIGPHTAWFSMDDTDKNVQQSDTVTFFVGESSKLSAPVLVNPTEKHGTAQWAFTLSETGRYRIVFKYSATALLAEDVFLCGDSIGRAFFKKKDNDYLSYDFEAKQAGYNVLQLSAVYSTGLPNLAAMWIFPLDGQAVPTPADVTGLMPLRHGGDEAVCVYTLSGALVQRTTLSRLGLSLDDRSSAVVVLPRSVANCVGGTPYIVRKQRLK